MEKKQNEVVLKVDNVLIEVSGLAWGGPQKDKKKKDREGEEVTLDVHDSFCG